MITIVCTEAEMSLLKSELHISDSNMLERPYRINGFPFDLNLGGMIHWVIGDDEQTKKACQILNDNFSKIKGRKRNDR